MLCGTAPFKAAKSVTATDTPISVSAALSDTTQCNATIRVGLVMVGTPWPRIADEQPIAERLIHTQPHGSLSQGVPQYSCQRHAPEHLPEKATEGKTIIIKPCPQ